MISLCPRQCYCWASQRECCNLVFTPDNIMYHGLIAWSALYLQLGYDIMAVNQGLAIFLQGGISRSLGARTTCETTG
jgi:hypothetical protein